MNWSDVIHWSRYALAVGLVIANVAVWYGVWLERASAPAETQERGWRILVRGLAAEVALGLLLFAADTGLDVIQRREIAQINEKSAVALREAGELGASFDGLHSLVAETKKGVDDESSRLRSFANDQKRRTEAVVAGLTRDKDRLDEASQDAADSLKASRKILADMNAALAAERAEREKFARLAEPRQLSDAQASAIVAALKPYRGQPVMLWTGGQLKEAVALSHRLAAILKRAGWSYSDADSTIVGSVGGLSVGVDPRASPKARAAAKALSDTLKTQGLDNDFAVSDNGQTTGPETERVSITVGQRE